MSNKVLSFLWGALFVLCVFLGLLPAQKAYGIVFRDLTALLFFLPGCILACRGVRQNNSKLLRRLRWVCIASLALTLILLVANFLSVLASEAVGNVLHVILTVVSTPMLCCRYWSLSMFLWACLLMSTLLLRKSAKKPPAAGK